MTNTSRLGLLLAVLLLIPVFFTPIWSITLTAPQYPDGIGMYIWVDDITGHERHDIQNINILNHYVGMQEIDPDIVPTLDIMSWVLAGLMILGLAAAVTGSRWLAWLWIAAFIIAGIAGMYDFYMWGYEYGHNLDPKAAIKVPGMTYQPPVIGKETLLNITAHSWPHWGSFWVGLSLFTGAGVTLWDRFAKKKGR